MVAHLILFFDGDTIPDGWTLVSDAGGAFYHKLIRGSSSYGGTGGAETHTHSISSFNCSVNGICGNIGNFPGAPPCAHTHAQGTIAANSVSNLPAYRTLKVISYDLGVPPDLPAGIIALFETNPDGWTRYSVQDGKYIYPDSNAGTEGGSNTHQHTVSGTTGIASGNCGGTAAGNMVLDHSHSFSHDSDTQNNEPPYREVILSKKNESGLIPMYLIGMFDDTPPVGWTVLSNVGGDLYQKILKPAESYGGTGGALTHTHGDVVGDTGTASASKYRAIGCTYSNTHAHTLTIGLAEGTHTPPYIDVIIAKNTLAFQQLTEALPLTDKLYLDGIVVFPPLTETLSLTDTVEAKEIIYLSEPLNLLDAVSVQGAYKSLLSESLNLLDAVSALGAYKSLLSESLNLLDAVLIYPPRETIQITDEVSVKKVSVLELSETLTISDTTKQSPVLLDTVKLYDSVKVKKIPPAPVTVNGAVWTFGSSEHPEPGVTVHLIRVSPRGNLRDYTTKTDENGYFEMQLVPIDEYVIVATKKGFTLGWTRINLVEDTSFEIHIMPLSDEYVLERTFNQYGHVYKVYTFKTEETVDKRRIWGIFVFGDLYDASAIEEIDAGGYLKVEYPGTIITLLPTQYLDNQAFFDAGETITQESSTKISWTASLNRRDFDGFTFYTEGPKMTVKIKVVIGEKPIIPEIPIPDPPAPSAGMPPSSSGNFSAGGNPSYILPIPAPYYDPPKKPVPGKYSIGLTERLSLSAQLFIKKDNTWMLDFKERLPIAAGVNLNYIELFETIGLSDQLSAEKLGHKELFLAEALNLSDTIVFPPPLSLTGQVVVGNPTPGGMSFIPLAGVTVVAYYKGTLIEIGRDTTDDNGFYRITGLPSHTEYDLYMFKEGYTTVKGSVYTSDKDLIEERARVAIESEFFAEAGTTYYYEAIISFPWLLPVTGGPIYGYIYNRKSLAKIKRALATAKNVATLEEYVGESDDTGFYKIVVPPGSYQLSAAKLGYRPSEVYGGTIASGWNQNLPLDPILPQMVGFYQRIGLRYVSSR